MVRGRGSFRKGPSLPFALWEWVLSPLEMIPFYSLLKSAAFGVYDPTCHLGGGHSQLLWAVWPFQSLLWRSWSPAVWGATPASAKEWTHPAIGSPAVSLLAQWLGGGRVAPDWWPSGSRLSELSCGSVSGLFHLSLPLSTSFLQTTPLIPHPLPTRGKT